MSLLQGHPSLAPAPHSLGTAEWVAIVACFVLAAAAGLGTFVWLARKGRRGTALALASVLGTVPLLLAQGAAAWLNLRMLPNGADMAARDGLALVVIYGVDAVWVLTGLAQAGVWVGLTAGKPTRFGAAWWLLLGCLGGSAVAFALIVPGRI